MRMMTSSIAFASFCAISLTFSPIALSQDSEQSSMQGSTQGSMQGSMQGSSSYEDSLEQPIVVDVPRGADSLGSQDLKAYHVARVVALTLGEMIDKRCLSLVQSDTYENDQGTKLFDQELFVYNVAIGRYRADRNTCPDPDYSIDVVMDHNGEFVLSRLIKPLGEL